MTVRERRAGLSEARYPSSSPGSAPRAYATPIVQCVSPQATSPPGTALTPAQVRAAYGFDQVMFGSIVGDGTGQTIAIIDAYYYPTAQADLQAFDAQFGLADPPSFTAVRQDGSLITATNHPPTDPAGPGNPNGTWTMESALDVQWAHAMAPGASIILVEANDPSYTSLITYAVNWARNQPGVVAISMSFSGDEFSGQTAYDSYFTTPSGHGGVTFLAATGDSGEPSGYPAYSPNVVAVGGTTLTLSGTTYVSETGWSGSGGGISLYENQPVYQSGVVSAWSTTRRTNPDIAMDADPNTGVAVYDSYDYPTSPWLQIGGTSLATPLWAGLIAVADQGRALESMSSLDGRTQALPTLYSLPASDFHDITSGNNGYAAGTGYDLVTGLGTPIANKLIYDLGGLGAISGAVFQDNNGNGVQDAGEPPLPGVTVFLDANNNGTLDPGATTTAVSTNVPRTIPDNRTSGVTSTLTFSGSAAPILDVNITFRITHNRDADLTAYLIGPDGTQVTLFSKVGGSGDNFTNTTLDDEATTAITSGSPPFSGTYRPSPGLLSAFDGRSAVGTWSFKVVDSRRSNTGSITAWSLAITTAGETSTITGAGGSYTFKNVSVGTYYVRQVVPAGDVQTAPNPGASPAGANVVTVSGSVTGQNFANFATVLTAAGDTDSYYVTLDPTGMYVRISAGKQPLTTPTYQIALALLPSLTFNLLGTNNSIYVDFVNGSPIPAGNITVNGPLGATDALHVLGQSPSQTFTMSDTQIGPDGGGAILYEDLDSLWILNCTVNYSGWLSTLNSLHIGQGTAFHWS